MRDRTITLRADLVERLEALAQEQGRDINDVFDALLEHYAPAAGNWALAVADDTEAAEIAWQDEQDSSEHGRAQNQRPQR